MDMDAAPRTPEEFIAVLEAELRATPYRPIGALGQGGMGAVFEIEHRTLRRKLVIKILREPNRPDLEDRLRLEAQALAQLSHPNLLQVVDYGHTASGRPFLVTERLVGKTLKETVGPTGSLPMHEAATYVTQALGALAVAHRAGIVHRDIKLDNLFLCDADDANEKRVKVIDFGIAKLVGAEGGGAAVNVQPLENPTAEGFMVGTPSFMSPEQVTNQAVDHRADIYGMGVVLYRLLAGRNPFICRDLIEYAAAHAGEIPAPPSTFGAIPSALDGVVLRALEKQPGKRYQSAKEMIEALASFTKPAPLPVAAAAPVGVTPRGGTQMLMSRTVAMEGAPIAPAQSPATGVAPRAGTQRMLSPPQGFAASPFPQAPVPLPAPPAPRAPMQSAPQHAISYPQAQSLPANLSQSTHHGPVPAPIAAAPSKTRTIEIVALVVAAISAGAIVWFALRLAGVLR
ncbi:MAG: serine/threonine protein kinase [Polyangiaceae bacterium]|nr:serine/threonine protein kinase [Polyangiaceae bacterium]